MTFTQRLYEETKMAHKGVDKHDFVHMIRKNKKAGEMYVVFNKICIYHIQTVFDVNTIHKNLFRNVENVNNDVTCKNLMGISENLQLLAKRCEDYPLQHAYMFYLGLLFGGNMLSKMLPDHSSFLSFEDHMHLITIFKNYLNEHFDGTNCNDTLQHDFIRIVNESYEIIKFVFSDFYNELSRNDIIISNCEK